MPGVYLLILSVLENFERRFITCFWFVGSCLHFFLFIYLFIIPPGEEFCPLPSHLLRMSHIRNSVHRHLTFSGCLTSGILSVDIPPSLDVSHPEFCPSTSHLLRMSHIRNFVRPTFHLLWISHIRRLMSDGRGGQSRFPRQLGSSDARDSPNPFLPAIFCSSWF